MPRAREIGITIGSLPTGQSNAITDVPGVKVGFTTLIEEPGVRTGLTVILPFEGADAVFAGFHRLNGNGEMTGTHWIRESGLLTTPIAITNTLSIGAVHEGLIRAWIQRAGSPIGPQGWYLPVVAETYDGRLNDILGLHVRPTHVLEAIDAAHDGAVPEGNVGGGTGMICHGFKGGTGTSSRRIEIAGVEYTVGVLVQANHGRRSRLQVNGAPVGQDIGPDKIPLPTGGSAGQGSIIVIVGTDAPLLPGQCDRLAQRASLGIGRTGGLGEDSSGDLILAFASGNRAIPHEARREAGTVAVTMLEGAWMDGLFAGVVDATEEAIINAILGAESMTGHEGATAYALDPTLLQSVLDAYNRKGD